MKTNVYLCFRFHCGAWCETRCLVNCSQRSYSFYYVLRMERKVFHLLHVTGDYSQTILFFYSEEHIRSTDTLVYL